MISVMINDTINKIEHILSESTRLPEHKKTTLLKLVNTLRTELGALEHTHKSDADLLVLLIKLVTFQKLHHPTHAVESHTDSGIATALTSFESSHPELVQTVRTICVSLSNLGI